jgi:hypothetical protein
VAVDPGVVQTRKEHAAPQELFRQHEQREEKDQAHADQDLFHLRHRRTT